MPSKKYMKGYRFEREVKEKLEKDGWYVIRSAGSKKPDLIAAKDKKVVVIECKVTKTPQLYLQKEEVEVLKAVASNFNADAMYAVKYKRKVHFFFIENLREKNSSFLLNLEE
ncbi:MAG: hypothetical protein GXN99_02260 [Candidatus Nanohaloarchaeota archaeon]|nr:hypothetical protein [Candidatus Nanohaloarchaeota archaeon]